MNDAVIDAPAGMFNELCDLAGLAAFQVDGDRNLTAWSPAVAELTGYDADDVLGLPCVVALRCPECMGGCGVFEHGSVRDIPLSLRRKDGSLVRVRKSGATLPDGEGGVGGAVEGLRPADGGDRRDGSMDRLLGALGREWLLTDGHFAITDLADTLAERIGRSASQLRGSHLADLFGDELFGPDAAFGNAVAAGERREGWRASLRTAAGEEPVSLSAGRIDASDGGRIFALIRADSVPVASTDVPLFEGMVARSTAMQRIVRVVELLRDNDATVLITGASGTGKELVARALHARSHRARGPFVAVNCGALPGELLESELFGHVRGAFTGAVRDRAGRFEIAEGGTLLLDEIGDMPLHLQVKLLRVLQTGQFERIGDSRSRKADVRVVAATHIDLPLAIAERRFRDDLYYRLRVVPIDIPPLSERPADLHALIDHLMARVGHARGRALRLSPDARAKLSAHHWPGNVRELDNALEYATAVCDGQTVHVADLPAEIRDGVALVSAAARPPVAASPPVSDGDIERCDDLTPDEAAEAAAIRQALAETRYRRVEAAQRLGMSRTTLWRKMKQYRLG